MSEILSLKVDQLAPNPMRPRTSYPHDSLIKLADSIRRYGILQPILVASTPVGYQIINGERRWRAARLAGITHIPAAVIEVKPEEIILLSLVENIQVEPLTIFEQAAAINRLHLEFKMPLQEIGQRLGLEVDEIEKRLKLLTLSDKTKNEILSRQISDREALALASRDTEKQIYQEVVRKPKHGF